MTLSLSVQFLDPETVEENLFFPQDCVHPFSSRTHLDLFLQVVTQQNLGVDEVVRGIKGHGMQGPAAHTAPKGCSACGLGKHQPPDGGNEALRRMGE